MSQKKSYIYMGAEETRVVLQKWGTRVDVKPGEVVESEIKLSGNFIVFDETILERYDSQITTQQSHIDTTTETFELEREELTKKQKAELKAFDANRDAVLDGLKERLDIFLEKKTVLAENISKATNIIDNQMAALEAKKTQIEQLGVEGIVPKAPEVPEAEVVVELTVAQLKARLDELKVTYPQHGLKHADYKALVVKAEAEVVVGEPIDETINSTNVEQKLDETPTPDPETSDAKDPF